MKALYGIIAITLSLALVACSEESSEVKETAPAAKKEDSASKPEQGTADQNSAAPTAAPNKETQAPAAESTRAPAAKDTQAAPENKPQASGSEEKSGSKTESACLKAVFEKTGESDVAVLSSEYSEANSLVMVGVGPQRPPWRCLVSNDGVVAEITSQTDEGSL